MFVMYCVNGTSRSSLLIESTDSMIVYRLYDNHIIVAKVQYFLLVLWQLLKYSCHVQAKFLHIVSGEKL